MDNKYIKQVNKEDAKALKWVSHACSKDRPTLTGIKINNGEIVACDGFRLHIAPTPTALVEGDGSILKPVNTLTVTPKIEEFEVIEADYPDVESITNQDPEQVTSSIAISQKLLADLKSMPTESNMLTFTFTKDSEPIHISGAEGYRAVIMPMHKG